jgi:hypothetical protein
VNKEEEAKAKADAEANKANQERSNKRLHETHTEKHDRLAEYDKPESSFPRE